MLLLILFAPLIAVALILFGAPARLTAIVACAIELIGTLFLFLNFDRNATGYQFVTAWNIDTTLGWRFALGADGLSLLMLLLTAIVSFSAIWFTAEISKNEGAFYSCLLLISAGAVGAFASIDLFCLSRTRAHSHIPAYWNLGKRQSADGGVENHHLPRARKFCSAARIDSALSQSA
jgi:NADH-quinone oxidoreductase subunit M